MKQKGNSQQYNCANIEKLAQQYIDGVLTPEENQLFQEHLEYCLPCDKKIEFEIKLKEIVRKKAKSEVPIVELKKYLNNMLNKTNWGSA